MLQRGNTLGQGKYQIIRKLGEGSYGIVYLADELALDRQVALKIVRLEHLMSPTVAQAFNDEARLVAKLDHPHVVPIYSLEKEELGGQLCHYIVMPYMEEGDLQTVLSRGGQDLKQKLRWMCQIADGLAYAHQHMIMHRDLKPQNIFVRHQDVRIGDFSLARVSGSTREMSGLQGTVAYMSPEQIQGGCADFRSDIYALGVTYYQMLTGDLPYDTEETEAMFWQHVKAPVPSARAVNPEVPHALDCLVQRMMAKNPASRPSADEAAKALRKLQDELNKPDPQPKRGRKKRRTTVSPEVVTAPVVGTVQTAMELTKEISGKTTGVLVNRLPQRQRLIKWLASAVVFLVLWGAFFFDERYTAPRTQWSIRFACSLGMTPPSINLEHTLTRLVAEKTKTLGLQVEHVDGCGNVTLAGIIASDALQQGVESDIRKIPGVRQVTWHLRPPPEEPPRSQQPEAIRQAVETGLRDKGLTPCLQANLPPRCKMQLNVDSNGMVTLVGNVPDRERKQEVEDLVIKVRGDTTVTWLLPLPEEMHQWVALALQEHGMTPCPLSGLPTGCTVRIEVAIDGIVMLIGNVADEKRKQEGIDLVKQVLGVADAQWRQPQPWEIRQWVEMKLQEERFLCLRPGQFPCLNKIEVSENGVVHLRGVMCYRRNQEQVSNFIKGILGVTDVATNTSINSLESWGRVPRQCLVQPWSD
jgi:serine/threonine protein kinase/osmotically-inducible protein OsmY